MAPAGVDAQTAAEVCARYGPKPEARALLRDRMTALEFAESLMGNRQYVNGIDFMAHMLPTRSGVWWGCLCLQHATGGKLTEPDRAALTAATTWVLWPNEAYRVAARAPAEAVGMGSPAGNLALAVNLVGATGPLPITPARAISNAVKLATTKADPARIIDTQRLYLELAIGAAKGKFSWPRG